MTSSFALSGLNGLGDNDSFFSSDTTGQRVREQMANEGDSYANSSDELADVLDVSAKKNRGLLKAANRVADADYYTSKYLDHTNEYFSNAPWLEGGRPPNDTVISSDGRLRGNNFDADTFGYPSPSRNLYPDDRPIDDWNTASAPVATSAGAGQWSGPRLMESSGQGVNEVPNILPETMMMLGDGKRAHKKLDLPPAGLSREQEAIWMQRQVFQNDLGLDISKFPNVDYTEFTKPKGRFTSQFPASDLNILRSYIAERIGASPTPERRSIADWFDTKIQNLQDVRVVDNIFSARAALSCLGTIRSRGVQANKPGAKTRHHVLCIRYFKITGTHC